MSKGKERLFWVALVVIAAGAVGFLWYQNYAERGKQAVISNGGGSQPESSGAVSEGEADDLLEIEDEEEIENFDELCQNGEWFEISEAEGETKLISGKFRLAYSGDEDFQEFADYSYFLEKSDGNIAVTGNDVGILDYFENREVEIKGVIGEGAAKEIKLVQIRCAGSETDKNLIAGREKLMNYINDNINSIAPEKAPYQEWEVDTIEFVDENNVYVEYYDIAEDDEDSDAGDEDTYKRILLRISGSDGDYDQEVLAYWVVEDDDYKLERGEDKFENEEDTYLYQYDEESERWERID